MKKYFWFPIIPIIVGWVGVTILTLFLISPSETKAISLSSNSNSRDVSARVYGSADQSIPNNIYTYIAFNNERWDTDDFHDNVTNNTRLTIPEDGKYLITSNIMFASHATGRRIINIVLNNTTYITETRSEPVQQAGMATALESTTVYDLVSTDYLETQVLQASGSSLNSRSLGNYVPEFSIQCLNC